VSLQELLKNIQKSFSFLFERYNFVVTYTFERLYPPHIRIGVESDQLPYIKILFVHEWATSVMIGTQSAEFENDVGWFSVRRIISFMLKRPLRWAPDKLDAPYKQFLLESLEEIATEFNHFSERIFDMFSNGESIKQWEENYRRYVRGEIQHKFNQPKTR